MIDRRIGAILLVTSILGGTLSIPADRAILKGAPALPGTRPASADFYGDPLPAGAVARLGTVRLFHEDGYHIAYSANGKILASAGSRAVLLWDAATGRALREFPGAQYCALSPDGTRLATCDPVGAGSRHVRIWDTASGKELHRWGDHGIFALCFSPDGKLVAMRGRDGYLQLWDMVHGEELAPLGQEGGDVVAIEFTRDGRTLIAGERNMQNWEEIRTRIWDVASGKECRRFPDQTFMSLSPDGQVMALTRDRGHTLQLVKLDTAQTLLTLKGFPGEAPLNDISSARIAPDGSILATACRADPAIRLWDARSGKALRTIPLPYSSYAFSIAFAADGKTLAVGVPWAGPETSRVRLFDPNTGAERVLLPGHRKPIRSVHFVADGAALVSIDDDRIARYWQASGKPISAWPLSNDPLAISPDGTLAAVSGNPENTLELRDTSTGKLGRELVRPRDGTGQPMVEWVTRAAFTPDGTRLALENDSGVIFLWDTAKGRMGGCWPQPRATALAVSADGETFVTGHVDCTVRLWNARTGQLIRQLGKAFENNNFDHLVFTQISSIAIAPDGKSIAAAAWLPAQSTIYLWDLGSGKKLRQLQEPSPGRYENRINSIAFSRDGKTLFSASADKTIHLWDVATGNERRRLEGHRSDVTALAVSPDGTRLASGSRDCTVLIWDVK
jgi:WD40 repeat protein